jgi:tetratricopeptide (TPR) repeat protein
MNIKKYRYLLFIAWIFILFLFAEAVAYIYLRMNPKFNYLYLQGYTKVIEQNKAILNQPSSERGFTIFFYGGSTMQGFPFHPTLSPAKWIELFVQKLYPNLKINLINFGEGGKDSNYILLALQNTIQYKPDLVVVLAGHNEFLRNISVDKDNPRQRILLKSSLYRLIDVAIQSFKEKSSFMEFKKKALSDFQAIEAKKALEATKSKVSEPEKPRPPDWWESYFFYPVDVQWAVIGAPEMKERLAKSERNFTMIMELCKANHIPILISTPPYNMKYRPFGNNFATKDESTMKQWKTYALEGFEFYRRQKFQPAIDSFMKAYKIDNTNAFLIFYIAECYEALGDFQNAAYYYQLANRYDLSKNRIFSDVEELMRSISEKEKAPYLNVHNIFMKKWKNGITDYDIIVDNAHPSLFGQYMLSEALFKFIRDNTIIFPSNNDEVPAFETIVINLQLEKEFYYVSNKQLGDYYRNHFDSAFLYYQKAYQAMPTKEITMSIIDLCRRFGKYEEAKPYLESL